MNEPLNEVKFRRAQVADFLQIAALDRVGWQQNKAAEFIPDGEHLWRFFVAYSAVFVAEHDEKIIGFANVFRANDEAMFLLHKVVVDRTFRGQGVGQGLLSKVAKECDCHGVVCLTTVDPGNMSMLHVCQKFGFTEKEYQTGYYRPEEHRYVLKRRPEP